MNEGKLIDAFAINKLNLPGTSPTGEIQFPLESFGIDSRWFLWISSRRHAKKPAYFYCLRKRLVYTYIWNSVKSVSANVGYCIFGATRHFAPSIFRDAWRLYRVAKLALCWLGTCVSECQHGRGNNFALDTILCELICPIDWVSAFEGRVTSTDETFFFLIEMWQLNFYWNAW